jgi:hypothetical integral membrane protein (TIGR02206 family)
MTSFRPFTTFHLVTAVVGLTLIGILCVAGYRRRGTPAEGRMRLALAWMILLEQLAAYAYWALPGHFRIDKYLPFHPCRLVVWLAGVSLVWPLRPIRTLVYFWSLSVCCQPILTPEPFNGLRDPDYWLFWFSHLAIVCVGLYDVVVRGYRPTSRDFGIVAIVSLSYAAIVAAIDLTFGWDYAFLGRGVYTNHNATDVLPPGPLRPFFLVAATAVVMAFLLLIWRVPPLKRRAALAEPSVAG